MRRPRLELDDKGRLTLRVRVEWLALAVAVGLHAAVGVVASLIPEPKKPERRIEFTLSRPSAPTPPPPPASSPEPPASAPPSPPKPAPRVARKTPAPSPPPAPSPVAPELLPSKDPPAHRARLPVVETSPDVAPSPAPETWDEQLRQQLAATTPRSGRNLGGFLAPSTTDLLRVAGTDPRLYDEQTERRLMQDFGPFFRRGIEALRRTWHPDRVLNQPGFLKRCGTETRTTYAVAVIDKEGDVVDVELRKPSGCPGLDDEAIAAFKRVAAFPHPPEGIFFAPDGTPTETARYPVRFIVSFDGGFQMDWL